MYRLFLTLIFFSFLACQNNSKTDGEIQYELYYDSIMVIHDRTMPMMSKIESLREELKKERNKVINEDRNKYLKITNLLGELNKAEDAMFSWMNGFNPDSVTPEQKLEYIQSELSSVRNMEYLMIGGIGSAESYFEE